MSFVVALMGPTSSKKVGFHSEDVTLFVGADNEGDLAQVGIGFFGAHGTSSFWGLLGPRNIIQSWRAMQILQRLDHIGQVTLCACWNFSREPLPVREADEALFLDLAKQVGGMEKLRALRREVLATAPDTHVLHEMIRKLREKGVELNARELQVEAEAGRIVSSPLIETLIREDAERRLAEKHREEEIQKPLAREESLGALFEDLGIENLIDAGCCIASTDLDSAVKGVSVRELFLDGLPLKRTTEKLRTLAVVIAPGVTAFTTAHGEIESPSFLTSNGKKLTFVSAKFQDGKIFVRTLVGRDGAISVEGCFTVPELRKMTGPLPSNPEAA